MQWTKDKPKEEGWFWVCNSRYQTDHTPHVYRMCFYGQNLYIDWGNDEVSLLEDLPKGFYFYGPLSNPGLPNDLLGLSDATDKE